MRLIRFEEFTEYSYWCYYVDETVEFIMLDEELDITKEYGMSLATINKIFYTDFTEEQFIKGVNKLSEQRFADFVTDVIEYLEGCQYAKYRLTKGMHEVFGLGIDVPEGAINSNENCTGFNSLIGDDKAMIFGINLHGDVSMFAFRLEYLPIFFGANCSRVGLDIFKRIPNELLFDKLLNFYISGYYQYDRELDKIVNSYSRERKLNLLLD